MSQDGLYDGLDDLPVTPIGRKRGQSLADVEYAEDVDALPTSTQSNIEVYATPASDPDGRSETVSARVPTSQTAILQEMLEDVYSPFKSRGEFMRWAYREGLVRFRQYLRDQHGAQAMDRVDTTIEVMVLANRRMASIGAQVGNVAQIRKQVQVLSEGVSLLVAADELQEAADNINQLADDISNITSHSWRRVALRALFEDEQIQRHIRLFVQRRIYLSDLIINAALELRVLDIDPRNEPREDWHE